MVLDPPNGDGRPAPPFRFSISATFTAEPVRPAILFWGRQLDAAFEVRFAPYNQAHQTLLDPRGEFARNTHGVNVLLVRLEDLGQFEGGSVALERLEANAAQLAGEVRRAAADLGSPLIFCLAAPSPAVLSDSAWLAFHHRVSARLEACLDEVPGTQFLCWERIESLYPVAARDNPEGHRIGHIPYSDLYFTALGTALVRLAGALARPPYKVIALDCDNTLWQGICGEDGATGVLVDAPRRALQQFMSAQRDAGMLLAISSKNNEADVREVFARNPGMVLRWGDFAAWRIDWESKAPNLEALARELNAGLDCFVFVDDNPKECAEVEQALPEVLALALPEDASEIPHLLAHVWAFDHPVVTEEDRQRNAYYTQGREFGRQARAAASLEQFLATLDLRLDVRPPAREKLSRAAQLTQRTNQFNLTTVRRGEADFEALGRAGLECLGVTVADRFGDYGLVGLMVFETSATSLAVDSFVLSCRVLGRGVEHRMLAHLAGLARERGLAAVTLRFVPTARNTPARQFFHDVSGSHVRREGDALVAELPVEELHGIESRIKLAAETHESEAPRKARGNPRRFVDYARIARELSRPEQILEAIRRESRGSEIALEAGATEIERQLAAIWSELLERPVTHRADNFFDLGGHSLLAVLLLLRVRETFGVDLPVDDLYSGSLTLRELAERIETEQLGSVDPERYAELLAEIEGLSDEEVRELLAKEERSGV